MVIGKDDDDDNGNQCKEKLTWHSIYTPFIPLTSKYKRPVFKNENLDDDENTKNKIRIKKTTIKNETNEQNDDVSIVIVMRLM